MSITPNIGHGTGRHMRNYGGITSHNASSVRDLGFTVGGVPKIIFRQIAIMNLAKAAKSELYE